MPWVRHDHRPCRDRLKATRPKGWIDRTSMTCRVEFTASCNRRAVLRPKRRRVKPIIPHLCHVVRGGIARPQ